MTAATIPAPGAATSADRIQARSGTFVHDLLAVASRAIKLTLRDMEAVIPAIIVPVFFFVVNIGSLQKVAEQQPGFDFKAFQLPVAIIFAVTGISRASTLVTDIQGGYFDRMLMTPMNRLAMLLGLMIADFALVVALSVPVIGMGFLVGVRFATGILGLLLFVFMAGLWGVAFTGFPYAIALKTGSPGAVQSSFILFFPFAFLTTSFLPMEALTDWLATIAKYNPVTYLLVSLRSLVQVGWSATDIAQGFAAIAGVAVVSQGLAFAALRGRVRKQ